MTITGTDPRTRPPRRFRRQAARLLGKATGPQLVRTIRNPDGSLILAPEGAYLWEASLPNGEPLAFTTPTPRLEYAGLIDTLAARLQGKKRGWVIVEHTDACRELGVGCSCQPNTTREVNWTEER